MERPPGHGRHPVQQSQRQPGLDSTLASVPTGEFASLDVVLVLHTVSTAFAMCLSGCPISRDHPCALDIPVQWTRLDGVKFDLENIRAPSRLPNGRAVTPSA